MRNAIAIVASRYYAADQVMDKHRARTVLVLATQ